MNYPEMDKVDFMLEAGKHEVAVIDYEIEDFSEELERIIKQWSKMNRLEIIGTMGIILKGKEEGLIKEV